MKNLILILAITLVFTSCKTESKSEQVKDLEAVVSEKAVVTGSDFSLESKWELDGFAMPESVFASANHKWLYVSNVNGAEDGYISRVSKDGKLDSYKWVEGLGSPTGSDLYDGKLYVASVKKLHIIDVEKGQIVQTISVEDAGSINDITINQATGQVFISDILGGKIYTLQDDKLVVWFQSPEIPLPNGLLVQGNTLIVANYGDKMRQEWKPKNYGSLFKINIQNKKLEKIISSNKKGVFDGIIEINGVLVASSNPTGQLFSFDGDKSYLLDATNKGIADINTDGETIYAPYLFDNKLVAFQKAAWDSVTTKEEYIEKAADNYYGDADGTSIATSDGLIKGRFGGLELKGTWNWEDEYFCRTSTLGTIDLGSDCIQIDVTDSKMRLILNKGTGMSVVYDRKDSPEITILSTFKIKPEQIGLYKKEMLGNQTQVRKEKGTLEMKLFQDKNNTGNFLVFGRNESEESLETHSEAVEDRGIADRVKVALVEAPKTMFLINECPQNTKEIKQIKPDQDDVILFFVFDIKDGYSDKLVTQLKKHTKLTRQEDGNLRFDFYSIKGKENTFVIQQHWKNDEAGKIHRKQAYTQETDKLLIEAIGNLNQQEYFVNQIEDKSNMYNQNNKKMIQVIGQFQAKPEHRDKFKKALMEVVKGSLKEPGCLGIRLFEDKHNPNMFFGYEQFTDEAAVAHHRSQPYELKLIKIAEYALEVPPKAYVKETSIKGLVYRKSNSVANSKELIVIGLFEMEQEQKNKLIAQYEKQIPNVRSQSGCISFNAYTVLGAPNQLAVIEEWQTQEIAREFSTTDKLSIETGKVLAESLSRPIPEYLHELREIFPSN